MSTVCDNGSNSMKTSSFEFDCARTVLNFGFLNFTVINVEKVCYASLFDKSKDLNFLYEETVLAILKLRLFGVDLDT